MSEILAARGVRAAKRAACGTLLAVLALIAALAFALNGDARRSSSAQWDMSEPLTSVERADGCVALTFDSGWGADYVNEVLTELGRRGMKATFFLTGYWMDENADKAEAIARAGHELGGHSVTHSRMVGMDEAAADAEISGVNARISALTGAPPRCFRPPYGDWDLSLVRRVRAHGQLTVTWSLDLQSRAGGKGLRAAMGDVQAGGIVLMSLCDEALVDELGGALDDIAARGLTPCTVSELAGRAGERFVSAGRAARRA